MSFSQKLNEVCLKISDECINCGNCVAECGLLQKIKEDPAAIALRQPSNEEAYACALCRLCEAVCPLSLCPGDMFAETRNQAVNDNYLDEDDFKYMFPDVKVNAGSLYREKYGINYEDISIDQECSVAFFPGCTMLTYSPKLTKEAYKNIVEIYGEATLLMDCCGLPLYQMGMEKRGDIYTQQVKEKVERLNIKSLIVACPNCYYKLK
ncbi:MAG: (Fe-S)-binding protein, partial [Eubacteriales bacterium]